MLSIELKNEGHHWMRNPLFQDVVVFSRSEVTILMFEFYLHYYTIILLR